MTNSNAIERKLILKASQKQVWEALTNPKKLSQWFGQSAEFELLSGCIGHFGWDNHGKFAMRIEQVQPNSYFAWRWMAKKDAPFDKDLATLVEWKLKLIAPNQTELYMIESGFKSPDSRSENVDGWNQELDHLQKFLNK